MLRNLTGTQAPRTAISFFQGTAPTLMHLNFEGRARLDGKEMSNYETGVSAHLSERDDYEVKPM